MSFEKLYQIYDLLIKIRLTEEAIIQEYPSQEIRTPVHLYIGQEAIAAGVSVHLETTDYIVSNHRSHGHSLAKGMSLELFFRELYGKQGGAAGGWGGSMHLCDEAHGIIGTSAIVAGGIPIGVGFALKQKIEKERGVTVIYFGDGAVDEGIFWESVNFASLKKLPVLFVHEDNQYASQTGKELRHAYRDIEPIIDNFGLIVESVNGNDAVEVADLTDRLLQSIRLGEGPAVLVCKTYRWMGHVGICDDSNSGYRTIDELKLWQERCPVIRMESRLKEIDPVNAPERIIRARENWLEQIALAIKKAKEAPYALD